ncbi:DUF1080 domain-containing protein [Verrucomicrobiaceae bacterium N1E253]|uniref:DUF1080 domain-containing protein n=1 Tax=Oceaniferula marina TaxID=2748318 RepID=A0A851GFD7_9BACT|nr:DUF1080 domain-containing protein [Oceaniferula marina]NWK56126.1 DUF1080 domain-containing protein [Oceaniferula marina]
MKKQLHLACVVCGVLGFASAACANELTDKEKAEGWVSLFDGKTLEGWRNYKGEGVREGWQVVDGTMQHTKKGGDLITNKKYQDFELKLEWKISERGNSGIFLSVIEEPAKIYFSGIEMQILDDESHPDGKFVKHRSGGCYGLYQPPAGAVAAVGSWNKVRVLKQGDHYQFFLNGVKTADFKTESEAFKTLVKKSKFKKWPEFASSLKGHIGLQDHGDVVNFRNLKIREIKK